LPWDPLFNPELFLEKMVNLVGNSSCFNTTPTDELLRMTLGHELKGFLLNYALAARQRAEVVTAKEKEVLVNNKLTALEGDVNAAKEKLKGEVKTLKKQCEEEVAKLVKEHDEELARIKKDHEAMAKTLKTVQDSLDAKDERLKALAKDNEVALFELASLRRDNEKLISERESLEENMGSSMTRASNMLWIRSKSSFLILIMLTLVRLMPCLGLMVRSSSHMLLLRRPRNRQPKNSSSPSFPLY
jgi:hypothetical protein